MRSYKTTVYACYLGSVTQAALINLTPVLFAVLLREYGLSYGALGFLVLTNFVTQVGADVAFSKAVDRHGFRPFVLAAGALSLVGLGVFAAAPLNHKPPEETLPIRGLARQKVFWLALGAIVFGAAAEVTMAQYASSFFGSGPGHPQAVRRRGRHVRLCPDDGPGPYPAGSLG